MGMKMTFTLLLLIFLSTALLQVNPDPEIISDLKQTSSQVLEAGNPSEHQQTCRQDVNAVLREMSAALAGLQVEMKYLQKESESQEKKASELEQQYQAQAAEVKKQELQQSELEQQYKVQSEELIAIKSKLNTTETQLEALKKKGEEKQVAFSASLMASGGGDIGPFHTHTPIIFRHVVTNIGNAYNSNTGFFIAPVKGAYHFDFHLYGHGHPSHGSGAVLVKNGEHIYNAYEHQTSHGANSANSAVLQLEVGDVVYLLQRDNTRIFDDQYHYTTFSGHLLFAM